jgi:PPP family 3-phenylpropionic acid transporter
LFGFLAVLLYSKGLSSSEIGLVTALSFLFSAFLQPLLGGLTDRKNIPTKYVIACLLGVVLIASMFLSYLSASSVLVMMLMFIIMNALRMSVMSLINALAMHLKNIGIPVNFGIARGLGSLFFALGG